MLAYNVSLSRTFDAIGWTGLLSDKTVGCIHPPPFGKQCTLPRELAISGCLKLARCTAITCPSQEPYQNGQPHKNIPGPICQLRAHADSSNAERGHGMCQPSGCVSLLLRPTSVLPEWVDAARLSRLPLRSTLLFVPSDAVDLIKPMVDASRARGTYIQLEGMQLQPGAQLFAAPRPRRSGEASRKLKMPRRLRREGRWIREQADA